jgi:hypothetical protein
VAGQKAQNKTREVELRQQIEVLNETAQSLEKTRQLAKEETSQLVRIEESVRQGEEGVSATMIVDKCHRIPENITNSCSDTSAQQFYLCAELPANVIVSAHELFVRFDGEDQPTEERRVNAGEDFGHGRFGKKLREENLSDSTKRICQGLRYWNTDQSAKVRLLIHYVPDLAASLNSDSATATSSSMTAIE